MRDRVRLAWLAAAVALVYGDTLWSGFTRDDGLYILTNPQVTHPSLPALFTPNSFSAVFRPLTFASFAFNWALAGNMPWSYHLLNLLLHAAVACLLYLFLRDVLVAAVPQAETVAFVAALLFAVHPIHTEAVSSVAGRPDLLAAGFLFAAYLLHLRNRETAALACFALALLSKESAVIFLPLVLVCDFIRGQWKPRLRYASMAGITLLYVGTLWKVQGGRFGPRAIARLDNPLAGLPAGWRILNALRVAWKYAGLQLYPRTLSCDYSFNQIPIYLDWWHTLPAAAAATAVVAAWIWALRKRRALPALAGGIYFAGFATTANFFLPIGTIMGERLAYFSSAGFCLLLAAAWVWLFNYTGERADLHLPHRRQRDLALALLALALASFSVRTILRNLDWRDDFTLALATVQAAPRSARAHALLGDSYAAAGQSDLAGREFQITLKINPEYPDVLEAYGLIEAREGHDQAAGWLLEKAFYTSDRTNRTYDFMAVNLAAIYVKTKHLDGALALLDREIAEAPQYAPAWSARALVHYQLGQAPAAGADAAMALRLDGDNAQAQDIVRQLNAPSPSSVQH